MTGHFRNLRLLLIPTLMSLMTGCHPTQPWYARGTGDLQHYIDKQVKQEYPDVTAPPLEEVQQSRAPLTLSNPDFQEIWDLKLEECVAIALNNTKIIRGGVSARLQNGSLFAGAGEGSIVSSPRAGGSIYNPAIVESNPGFGNSNSSYSPDGGSTGARQGVEAALAEFDANLRIAGGNNANAFGPILTTTNRPQNVISNLNGFPQTLSLRQGALSAELSKKTIEGTTFIFRNTYDYEGGNQRGTLQALSTTWATTFEVEARHPLLQGRGAQINRIPIIIARIAGDRERMQLQQQLNSMLCNVEIRYWDLHLAYRALETAKAGRDSALRAWRSAESKSSSISQGDEFTAAQPGRGPGGRGSVGSRDPGWIEAQAREQYYTFRAQVEQSLRELYNAEGELRLLMGLAPTDGRLIRPKDEPTLARVEFEWNDVLNEALTRRPELIDERWELKRRELEMILARNQLLPQLDVGALYRWFGQGDNLINAERNGINFPNRGSTAFDELTEGNYQEATIFGQFSMPVGFRRAMATVRHAQLRLAREKSILEDMELDVTHGLTKSIRNIDAAFQLVQTNANRWQASAKEVEALEPAFLGGRTEVNIDQVLEAHRRRANAQNAFWNSVVEYNKAIADIHCRKGSIMDYNGIAVEEGPWPAKAYWDAKGLARERDASLMLDYGWTRPKVVSRGEVHSAGGLNSVERFVDENVMENSTNEVTPSVPFGARTPEVLPRTEPSREIQPQPEVEMIPIPRSPGLEPPPADPNLKPQVIPEAKVKSIIKSAGNDSNPLRGINPIGIRMEKTSEVRNVQHQEPIHRATTNRTSTNQSDRQTPGIAAGG